MARPRLRTKGCHTEMDHTRSKLCETRVGPPLQGVRAQDESAGVISSHQFGFPIAAGRHRPQRVASRLWTPVLSASGGSRPSGDIGRAKVPASKLPLIVDKNPLLGTWKMKSCVVTTAACEQSTPYGENPKGYLSYSADGRMQAIGAANGRRAPAGASPRDNERVALYDTMFAYAGTYSVEGGKVIHHVDISWNEVWTGTDQIRLFEVNGNILTVTARIPDPVSGVESHYAVVCEKVASPR